jgi:hypothetical protein
MSELLKPPAVPMAILNFFSTQPDFAAVIGDIREEFHQRVQISGAAPAKLWFWREAFRNALALTAREVMRTPGRTFVVAFGCLLAVNAATALYIFTALYFAPFRSIADVILNQNQIWRDGFLSVQFVASLAVGWIGGSLLPGREWALAWMYFLVTACVAGMGMAVWTWYLSISPASLFLDLPESLRTLMIWEVTFRLGAFWLGCLWIRRSRRMNVLMRVE